MHEIYNDTVQSEKIDNYTFQGFGIRKSDSKLVETRHTNIYIKLSLIIFRYSDSLAQIFEVKGQN